MRLPPSTLKTPSGFELSTVIVRSADVAARTLRSRDPALIRRRTVRLDGRVERRASGLERDRLRHAAVVGEAGRIEQRIGNDARTRRSRVGEIPAAVGDRAAAVPA